MTATYAYNFRCSLHAMRFAFDGTDGIDSALMRCPACMFEREAVKDKAMSELKNHRDTLMKAIDLTKLVQDMTPKGEA